MDDFIYRRYISKNLLDEYILLGEFNSYTDKNLEKIDENVKKPYLIYKSINDKNPGVYPVFDIYYLRELKTYIEDLKDIEDIFSTFFLMRLVNDGLLFYERELISLENDLRKRFKEKRKFTEGDYYILNHLKEKYEEKYEEKYGKKKEEKYTIYKKKIIQEQLNNPCIICYKNLNNFVFLKCGHIYHRKCIKKNKYKCCYRCP